jgi:hypothetical protein
VARRTLVRVRGMVSIGGAAMSQSRRADGRWDLWRVGVGLRPWRAEGGQIQTSNIALWKPTRLPFWFWRLLFRSGTIIEMAVDPAVAAEGRGRWSRFLGWRTDPQLREAQADWRSAKVLEDPELGPFQYDERLDLFSASASWRGRPVKLSLGTDRNAQNPPVDHAREIFENAEGWERKAQAAILAELLPLKNENWLGDDESPLSPDQFLARMTLETVSVDPGMVQFYYHDGDLFWGHTIIATFDEEEDQAWAEIAG